MKIAYLSTTILISDSANSVHITRMCQAFARQGHDVTLHGLAGDGDGMEIFAYYGVTPIFDVERHDERADPLVGGLWALRGRLPFLRVGGLPSVLFGRRVIDPRLRAAAPDLIYARNLNWLAGVSLSVPFIAESHQPPQNAIERHLETRLFRRPSFERLVVISDKLKALYVAIFPWLAPQILVAHDGADDPRPDRSAAPPREDGFHVGYVGHLYAGRGVEVILALARAVPQATFHLVGGRAEACRRLAASTDLGNVILHGHQPPHALAGYFERFDVMLAPYQERVAIAGNRGDSSAYMSPLKIFEYLSWGKAILCSDLPVLREILADGENALLLPSADVAAWAGALRRLMADEALRRRLGNRARQDFLAHHSWERRARHVLGQSVDPCARKEPTL